MSSRARFVLGALLLPGMIHAADRPWIRLSSGDLELFSDAGESGARKTLKRFEQIRSFFERDTNSGNPAQGISVRVIAFNSPKEFDPYKPNEGAAAFAQSGSDHDYIVLSSVGDDGAILAAHEYVHIVAQHEGLHLPPWLNEGLADLYSTLQQTGDRVVIGIPVPGRYQFATQEKWVPLSVILAADQSSPYYNEKTKASSLYSEGWALTHMLIFDDRYRGKYHDLIEAIQRGTPSEAALTAVYGRPLKSIEDDLQDYLRRGQFRGASIPVRTTAATGESPAEPVSAFDVNLMLTSLLNRPGREDEVRKRLAALMAEAPTRPEPWVELGYLEGRDGRGNEAARDFGKAWDLGTRSPKVLWDYGRVVSGSHPARAAQVYRRFLEIQPDRRDARVELATLQLALRDPKAALETLKPVTRIGPEDAPRVYRILAYAQALTGHVAAARATARKWQEIAPNPAEKAEAAKLVAYVDQMSPDAKPDVQFTLQDAGTPLASIPAQPNPAPARMVPIAPEKVSVVGLFLELQCVDSGARVVLQGPTGRETYLIDDPGLVLNEGKSGVMVDLTCGPQTPHKIRLEFIPPGEAHPGVKGLVRAIHFNVDDNAR